MVGVAAVVRRVIKRSRCRQIGRSPFKSRSVLPLDAVVSELWRSPEEARHIWTIASGLRFAAEKDRVRVDRVDDGSGEGSGSLKLRKSVFIGG